MSQDFGIIPVHPDTLLGEGEVQSITGDYLGALEELGGKRWSAHALPDDTAQPFILVATGGTEQVILEVWAERQRTSPDEPLFLIAHPGNNSLPAALEVLARLQQEGAEGRIFYLSGPDDEDGLGEIADAVHDIHVRRALQRARIGLVGQPSDWLVASMPDASTIKATWGPTVVPVEMKEVVENFESVSKDDFEPHVTSFIAGAEEVREPTASDVGDVARIYLALKKVAIDHELDALTVRCFDFVQQQRTTGCFGLAQLTDEGVMAGCEGDLVSTIGLLWVHKLLGITPWMANPAQLHPASNTLWLAHCTVPRTLVGSFSLRSHFESGLGVGIQGTLPTGPVTLLRIGGKKLDRMWLAEGENLRAGYAENLCRTQVEIRLTRGGTTTDLLRAPLGNHLVLVFGHHLERLRSWCEHLTNDVVTSDTF
jgi:L-fucose isomerase-like protein